MYPVFGDQELTGSIEMDMNNRNAENRSELKEFDLSIEEINNKFTISLGDLRTEIESAKWDATRRAICTTNAPPRGPSLTYSNHRNGRNHRSRSNALYDRYSTTRCTTYYLLDPTSRYARYGRRNRRGSFRPRCSVE
jgi:hypothetical protein